MFTFSTGTSFLLGLGFSFLILFVALWVYFANQQKEDYEIQKSDRESTP